MEWSTQQQAALDAFSKWLDNPSPVFYLTGNAGAGKSTLSSHMASLVGGTVYYIAFTGKAAQVLQTKGCLGARTIHSLIYLPRIKCAEKLKEMQARLKAEKDPAKRKKLSDEVERERENLARPAFTLNTHSDIRQASLVVLDEASMLGQKVGLDLFSFGVPVLAMGDPGQLPPVGDEPYFKHTKPNAHLSQIHRQAEGDPIIEIATKLRQDEWIPFGYYGESRVCSMPKGGIDAIDVCRLAEYDQIIVGKNATRHTLNRRIRSEYYERLDHLPVEGDKLVCVKNDYNYGLMNGSQWYVVKRDDMDEDNMILTVTSADAPPEDRYEFQVPAFKHYFEGRKDDIEPYWAADAVHFEFGYAITCHKAQGSQYDSVVVLDESYCFRDQRNKWAYTAATRAAKKLTFIR